MTDYRSKTRNWIIPLLGKHRIDRLTPEHLDTAYTLMLRPGLSPSTVLKVHRILSRALRIAVRRGRISRNVATLVDAPAEAPNEIEPLTRDKARRILAAATKRNGARWSVALALGIRQGEALGLLLKDHRKRQAAERLRAGNAWRDHDLVFATRHGGPIERTEDWRPWKAILRQARVRDARVHDARHTAATLLIEQGVHIRVVQEVLGHTRVTTTERYTHVATLQMRDASERMSEALWGQG